MADDGKHPLRSWTIRFFGFVMPAIGGVVDYLGEKQNQAIVQTLLTPRHFGEFVLGVGLIGCLLRKRSTQPLSGLFGQGGAQ